MGFRKEVLLGFVLLILLYCGNLALATQNSSHTNETVHQLPLGGEEEVEELEEAGIQPRSASGSELSRRPVTYRLKIYQLRKLGEKKAPVGQKQGEDTNLISDQLVAVNAPQLLKAMVKGPDLNPPVKQETKVDINHHQV